MRRATLLSCPPPTPPPPPLAPTLEMVFVFLVLGISSQVIVVEGGGVLVDFGGVWHSVFVWFR